MEHTDFFEIFIKTHDDGRDFFPYRDFVDAYGRKPTRGEVAGHIYRFVEYKEMELIDKSRKTISNEHALRDVEEEIEAIERYEINGFNWSDEYREKVLQESIDYILE
mgnify:FL=1